MTRKPRYSDDSLIGQRFGKLVVVSVVDRIDWRRKVLCNCDCGNQCIRFINALMSNTKRGATPDCGCFRQTLKSTLRHGKYLTKEYFAWIHIKQRCYNENNAKYHEYGGRGITVCPRWLESFENFYADMGDAPAPEYSINRKDNDGDYEPDNCEWAPPSVQSENKRSTVFIEYHGKRMKLCDAAKQYGVRLECLRKRIRSGWDVHRALNEPVGTYHNVAH